MAYDETITVGTQNKSIEIVMRDSATGQGKTGLTPEQVTASYVREGGGSVRVALNSVNWGEVNPTDCPGLYRFAIPNEALADGAAAVTLCFTASGTIDKYVRIALIKADLRDPVRAGLTALPNADAGTNGGLPVAGTGANQISLTGGKVAVRSIDSGVITDSVIADGAITASKFANNAINSQNLAETAAGKVANSVWSHNNRNLSQTPPGVIELLNRLSEQRANYLDLIPNLSTSEDIEDLELGFAGVIDMTSRLYNMTEMFGNPAYPRFKTSALEAAPSGGGGGGGGEDSPGVITLLERLTAARARYLDDIPSLANRLTATRADYLDQIPSLANRLTETRAGHLDHIPGLANRLTATRAGYLDLLPSLANWFTEARLDYMDHIPSLASRLTEIRAGYLDLLPSLAYRLTEDRAGYLDQIPILGYRLTPARASYLEYIPSLAYRLTADRAGYLDQIPTLASRLTETRAGYLDYLETLTTLEGGSRKFKPSAIPNIDKIPTIETDVTSVKNTLAALNARLTETRAGYLDHIPSLANRLTDVRVGHLDHIPSLANRLTEARAGYLDHLNKLNAMIEQSGQDYQFKRSALINSPGGVAVWGGGGG